MEDATRLFTEVQSAYEVLSDPQERAWYDSHQNVLFQAGSGEREEYYQRDVKITTAEDLVMMCLDRNAFSDFSDRPTGFFTTVREVFDRLAFEETIACEIESHKTEMYPSFGSANDAYEDTVRPFYSAWSNFATQKSFAWCDLFRYSDATDRRTRRLMDKENKRYRDESIREFNDAVRMLVAFVKKRDPRYTPSYQTDADRHKSMREKAAAQAAQARAANQAKLAGGAATPRWAKADDTGDPEFKETSEDESEEHFECIVCKKTFKSENQFEAHEKSKKHSKAVRKFTREMQRENVALGLDANKGHAESSDNGDQTSAEHHVVSESTDDEKISHAGEKPPDVSKEVPRNKPTESPTETNNHVDAEAQDTDIEPEDISIDTDDEYAPRDEVQERVLGSGKERSMSVASLQGSFEHLEVESLPTSAAPKNSKMGKAAKKRARKAAKNGEDSGIKENKCATCHASFPSKTKLFNHIKELGHARPADKKAKNGGR